MIEDKIISMYAKGMTTRDIRSHIEEIYGIEVSPTFVSNVTEKIMHIATEWQNRPLDEIYPIVFNGAKNIPWRLKYGLITGLILLPFLNIPMRLEL